MFRSLVFLLATFVVSSVAWSQVEVPDFRIRAKFRTPNDGAWGADESVGNARFRVQSRFLQVYYGGVMRSDEFKFRVAFDFTQILGFDTEFAGSMFDSDYDVYINDSFVGRVEMSTVVPGMGELQYDTRNPNPPALPLPTEFPDPVNVFDTVRVYIAAAVMPNIGDGLPLGVPLFVGELVEEFARGDANLDGKVDVADAGVLAANYDPFELLGLHIGPALGDFSGDSRSTADDYNIMVQNWTDSSDVPSEPTAVLVPCYGGGGLADVDIFTGCITGPAVSRRDGCQCGDANRDGRIDLLDAAALQQNRFGQ